MAVRDVVQAAAGVGGDKLYVEDVFSTYLYTGNGSTQTITNGIDLAGEGGLAWFKTRVDTEYHTLFDTERGTSSALYTNVSNAAGGPTNGVTSFNSDGFTLGSLGAVNYPYAIASWTFRKAPKFFDVVTYTGDGTSSRQIAHDLGSTPGFIVIKRTDTNSDWVTSFYAGETFIGRARLNSADAFNGAAATNNGYIAAPHNADTFGTQAYGSNVSAVNATGGTYVAYLFASNAGGFGDDGEQNVISCGSYTGNSGTQSISLGYEPQWILLKRSDGNNDWWIFDTMRGWRAGSDTASVLWPNLSNAELSTGFDTKITSTGFTTTLTGTFIYIAIRRGPMKVPESGTSVYNAIAYTGNDASNRQLTGLGFPPDLALVKARSQVRNYGWEDRLRGADKWLVSSGTDSEGSFSDFGAGGPLLQDGITIGANGLTNEAPTTYIFQGMRRAPGFFDVVAYTGTGVAHTEAHNLGVVPELMIVKSRSAVDDWPCYFASLGTTKYVMLNRDERDGDDGGTFWNSTAPTASVFSVATDGKVNGSGSTYVAYLFATCPGVSKVGSYTGTGTTQQIDCGFSGGARFVLIKRTSGGLSSNWYVWDSARGIVAGNDPYLLINSTAAEVTSTDYIDTYSAGFEISSTAPADVNASGFSFVFLAIS